MNRLGPQLPKPALAVKIIAQRLASLGTLTMEPWGQVVEFERRGDKLVPHLSFIARKSTRMHQAQGTMEVVAEKFESGAEGGSRTRTSFRTTDFNSVPLFISFLICVL